MTTSTAPRPQMPRQAMPPRQVPTLDHGAVQTMPFARPRFDELLAAVDLALAKDDTARGEYAGAV